MREDEGGEYGDLEDDEDAILERGTGVVELKEHEAREEGDGDMVEQPGKAVVGRAPEGFVSAELDGLDLVPKWSGILPLVGPLQRVSLKSCGLRTSASWIPLAKRRPLSVDPL